MTPRFRLVLFALACLCLVPAVLHVALAMPVFGAHPLPYGDAINAAAPGERHVSNMVSAVNFDYRGFDTLGEEFMLLCAVTRNHRPSARQPRRGARRPGGAGPGSPGAASQRGGDAHLPHLRVDDPALRSLYRAACHDDAGRRFSGRRHHRLRHAAGLPRGRLSQLAPRRPVRGAGCLRGQRRGALRAVRLLPRCWPGRRF